MKKVFEIEFPDDPSVLGIEAHDMRECMFHSTHIFPRLQSGVTVTDITDEIREEEYGEHLVSYPTRDAWDELHVILAVDPRGKMGLSVEQWLHEYVFIDDDAVFESKEFPEGFWAKPSSPSYGIPYWIVNPQPKEPAPMPNLAVAREAMADFDRGYWQEIEDVIRDFACDYAAACDAWRLGARQSCYDLLYVYDLMEWRAGFYEWINGRE